MIRWLLNLLLGPAGGLDRDEKIKEITTDIHAETDRARRLRALTYEWEVRARRPRGVPPK